MFASLLVLALAAAPTTATRDAPRDRERMMCRVTRELRVAIVFGSDAELASTAIANELGYWDCIKLFVLPSGIPTHGDSLPEGGSRIADRIGVDWIILVGSTREGSGAVAARLIELSNLSVMASKVGVPTEVVLGLLTPVYQEMEQASVSTVRVTVQLEPTTFASLKALQADLRALPGVKDPGSARLVDGRGILVVQYVGGVDELVSQLDRRPLKKQFVEVKAVKLRRIELTLVDELPPLDPDEPEVKESRRTR